MFIIPKVASLKNWEAITGVDIDIAQKWHLYGPHMTWAWSKTLF